MNPKVYRVDLASVTHHAYVKYIDPALTPWVTYKRLAQHLELMVVNDLIRRMEWVDKTHYHNSWADRDYIKLILSRLPATISQEQTRHALQALLDQLYEHLCHLLDEVGCQEGTTDVWVVKRHVFEFQLQNLGDFRIHVYNHMYKNHTHGSPIEWDYVQGIEGYGIRSDYWVQYTLPGYVDTRLCRTHRSRAL